ncbi:MAG: two-component system, sensor histidine kinase and response regulator [Bacteroidota bacterium]|nr:two-component system, sensor histidine kinase and response regulator [Bacteroidota bacterium]
METILIIEDEIDILENLSEFFQIKGYKTHIASDGKDGIELAMKHLPDLILCDIQMPEVDGYEVINALKQNPETYIIPFIFLTARTRLSDLRYGMDLGADDYIIKPYLLDDVYNAVSARLEKYKRIRGETERKISEIQTNIANSLPHEFRTPLNGILGFAQILRAEYKELTMPDIEMMLDNILESGERLLRLVINFTYYASLLNGKEAETDKNEKTIFPDATIADITSNIVNKYKRDYVLDLDNHDNIVIRISESRFAKIITELLDNAFKFSLDSNPVEINTMVYRGEYSVIIKNTGKEITQYQTREITAFNQFDRNMNEQQGTGLGLAIVKKVLEKAGGEFILRTIDSQIIAELKFSLLDS